MNTRRRAGMIVLFLCMAAILGVIWYCLFAVSRQSYHEGGTFVRAIEVEKEERIAA